MTWSITNAMRACNVLRCRQIANERNLAVIGGRAFVTAADYRVTVERLRGGDLRDLAASEPLSNVIFAERPNWIS